MHRLLYILFLLISFQYSYAQEENANNVQEERYEGHLNIDGLKEGTGTYYWADGTTYKGRWKADMMNGWGEIKFPDGSKYTGNFVNGIRNGHGIFIWANGDKYQGGFKGGKMHGSGILVQKSGIKHEGTWVNGKSNGEGVHTYEDASQYIGGWKDNLRHGEGIMLYANGKVEQGTWKEDKYIPCKCTREIVTVDDAFNMSEAVFVGKVFMVETNQEEKYDKIGLIVEEHWKGEMYPGRKIYLYAEYKSCDFVYFEGERLLVYANKHPIRSSLYYPDKCTRTRKLLTKSDEAEINLLRTKIACDIPQGEERKVSYDFTNDPVCGCDGKTYKNPYQAYKAGVGHWKAGKCEEKEEN